MAWCAKRHVSVKPGLATSLPACDLEGRCSCRFLFQDGLSAQGESMQQQQLGQPVIHDIPHDIGKPDAPPERSSKHERMAACIGTWRMRGTLTDSGAPMDCTERYEWV